MMSRRIPIRRLTALHSRNIYRSNLVQLRGLATPPNEQYDPDSDPTPRRRSIMLGAAVAFGTALVIAALIRPVHAEEEPFKSS